MSTLCASINKALNVASRPSEMTLSYGTAGFRSKAENLKHAMIRCGMLAVLRSQCHHGLPVGVCVTASHNPVADNGVKIVEPDGGMLVPEFEAYASELINSSTPFSSLEELVQKACKINLSTASEDTFKKCRVVIASDTRPSSPVLVELVKLGVCALGASFIDAGVTTTPVLHWTVLTRHNDPEATSRQPEEFHQAYYQFWLKKAEEFKRLMGKSISNEPALTLTCDAACGVGGPAMEAMRPSFEVFNCNMIVRNRTVTEEVNLNDNCGAEHVQKNRAVPKMFGASVGDQPGTACVALDGDADRVVFFTIPEDESKPLNTLIDGDRIAVIISKAIMKLLGDCVKASAEKKETTLSFGIVQTAYANGASTACLRDQLETPGPCVEKSVVIAKTGVKNVHHEAVKYDIGVYFESNGHGTVTYKREKIEQWAASLGIAHSEEFARLMAYLGMINDCVGDAIVDALAMIAAMRLLDLDFSGVLNVYKDLEVMQSKVGMSRSKLNELKSHPVHELHLVEPVQLQNQINAVLAQFTQYNARAFVRASGTEDACRIYAEATNAEAAAHVELALKTLLENY